MLARAQADRRDLHGARMESSRGDREADLRRAERDGRGRLHRNPRHLAGRGIHPRRHVDRDRRTPARVDQLDHPRGVLSRRILQADAQQRIDDHVRLPQVADALDQRHAATGLAQNTRAHLAVTAVVAPAAHDGDPARIVAQDVLGDCRARPLHQILQRSLMRFLRTTRLVSSQQRLQPHGSTTTATAAASSREWVIESSIEPAPTFSAHCAVRPVRKTPGFGRPRISISFHVK